ncbi:conserved hypothetical protein [Verticillium alfalfae VaMs.102]|uniref:Suppressor protein SRP40 n=1 Tax=Verticillium alfalfae (strain VaMs.102 / ATCC MYA-4576 / FGSC 10136) TaxID=526221 RepID=C9SWR7_VERA1|nr:conserved hypothetical protein [Verticillium alfalfae VaMs.102]EEY23458.1 conserved hypothetical protein [Verticillium alfalfae VaMs.102]
MPESPSLAAPASRDQAPTAADPDAYIRLHITPFDADLLKVVVPASALPKARSISFHNLQTFPEKRYGFVELPAMDAEKIKKKLNGAVLKGSKMRVEKARPEPAAESAKEEETGKKRKTKSSDDPEGTKKRKRDYNVIPGVELEDRKVKRGWTVTDEDKIKEKRNKKDRKDKEKSKEKKEKKKKREERSKYTDKEECLLKTKLPANAPVEKRKKGKSRETVIHEFSNTTKYPSFLKSSKPSDAAPSNAEYVEGKGWVDEEGNVVEAVKVRKPAEPKSDSRKKKKTIAPPVVEDDTTSSSGSSSEDDDSEAEAPAAKPKKAATPTKATVPAPVDDDATSSSGSSSEEDDASEEKGEIKAKQTSSPLSIKVTPAAASDDETSSSGSSADEEVSDGPAVDDGSTEEAAPSPASALKGDASRPKSSSSSNSLTIKIPPATPAKVHPLEALYKRARAGEDATTTPAKESQPFSFFGGGGDNDDIEEDDAVPSLQIPMTPYTQEDFEWRNIRSAAPTPDTAHPSRIKNFWAGDELDEDEADDTAMADGDEDKEEGASAAAAGPSGDFQKWFWENRGDLNKSWMKRKKTAAKEKRHRENKSRANRAV